MGSMSEEEIKEQFQALNDELTGIREALSFFFGSRYEEKIAPSTRGPEWTDLWCTGCDASRIAG